MQSTQFTERVRYGKRWFNVSAKRGEKLHRVTVESGYRVRAFNVGGKFGRSIRVKGILLFEAAEQTST